MKRKPKYRDWFDYTMLIVAVATLIATIWHG
jgi:hypothetical protein